MKNLLNMSDSDDDEKISSSRKKDGKRKAPESDGEEDNSGSDSEEGEEKMQPPKDQFGNKKGQGEDLRKMRETERIRREEEEKAKVEKAKRMSMFLGESHGHYKLGVFVRIEL
jgi:transcription initiation factor TFIIIB Brf1 subunit/transcription initiation factor TFIIB